MIINTIVCEEGNSHYISVKRLLWDEIQGGGNPTKYDSVNEVIAKVKNLK